MPPMEPPATESSRSMPRVVHQVALGVHHVPNRDEREIEGIRLAGFGD